MIIRYVMRERERRERERERERGREREERVSVFILKYADPSDSITIQLYIYKK